MHPYYLPNPRLRIRYPTWYSMTIRVLLCRSPRLPLDYCARRRQTVRRLLSTAIDHIIIEYTDNRKKLSLDYLLLFSARGALPADRKLDVSKTKDWSSTGQYGYTYCTNVPPKVMCKKALSIALSFALGVFSRRIVFSCAEGLFLQYHPQREGTENVRNTARRAVALIGITI